MSSFSQYYEVAILNLITGKSALALPTPYLALLTVVPTSASTGATITEATYTGYARLAAPAASWAAPVAGTPSTVSNSATLTFAACTAGTSTIVGAVLIDSATIGAGNVLGWGTLPNLVVSTTQTPVTFVAGAITITAS